MSPGGYSHRCCTDSCNRGQNVVKQHRGVRLNGQAAVFTCQDNVNEPIAHAHYAWVKGSIVWRWGLGTRLKGQGHKSGCSYMYSAPSLHPAFQRLIREKGFTQLFNVTREKRESLHGKRSHVKYVTKNERDVGD